VKHGFRILSSYAVGRAGERVWIITEADPSGPPETMRLGDRNKVGNIRAGKVAPGRPGCHLPAKRRAAGRLRDVRRAASQALLRTLALHVVDHRHVD
jgi:hypothetical protein